MAPRLLVPAIFALGCICSAWMGGIVAFLIAHW